MKQKRPVNLDFSTFKLPLPALTSIAHRISGVILFFGVTLLLYLFDLSLNSPSDFDRVKNLFSSFPMQVLTWVVVSALLYHLLAGIKHLIMDLGIGETIEGGKRGARLVIVFAAIGLVLAGVWIW